MKRVNCLGSTDHLTVPNLSCYCSIPSLWKYFLFLNIFLILLLTDAFSAVQIVLAICFPKVFHYPKILMPSEMQWKGQTTKKETDHRQPLNLFHCFSFGSELNPTQCQILSCSFSSDFCFNVTKITWCAYTHSCFYTVHKFFYIYIFIYFWVNNEMYAEIHEGRLVLFSSWPQATAEMPKINICLKYSNK